MNAKKSTLIQISESTLVNPERVISVVIEVRGGQPVTHVNCDGGFSYHVKDPQWAAETWLRFRNMESSGIDPVSPSLPPACIDDRDG